MIEVPTSQQADSEHDIEDLEICAKEGRAPRRTQRYRIRIDKASYIVTTPRMTGRQLLQLADKTGLQRWKIFQKLHGGEVKEIPHGQEVDFTTPGIEKFKTLPLDQTEGEGTATRRKFQLPETDVDFLDHLGLRWETVTERKVRWLFIHEMPIPEGYNHATATVALRIEAGYPDTQLDMCYFHPALERADGKSIGALCTLPIAGKKFQRWSRHRTMKNPWRPGVDDIGTHFKLVEHWLLRELTA